MLSQDKKLRPDTGKGCTMRLPNKSNFLALACVAAATVVMATESPAAEPANLSEISGSYAAVTNGWYVEQKCNALPAKERKELEWQVWRINEWVARYNGVPYVVAAQNHAQTAAGDADCSADASKIAQDTLTLARSLGGKMTGEEYSRTSSHTRYDMRRYTRAALGIEVIMEKCNHFGMSDTRWKEVKASFADVAEKLRAQNAELMKEAQTLIDAQKEKFSSDECNERAEQMANAGLHALQGLESSLKE
jgi:hypothetical protein